MYHITYYLGGIIPIARCKLARCLLENQSAGFRNHAKINFSHIDCVADSVLLASSSVFTLRILTAQGFSVAATVADVTFPLVRMAASPIIVDSFRYPRVELQPLRKAKTRRPWCVLAQPEISSKVYRFRGGGIPARLHRRAIGFAIPKIPLLKITKSVWLTLDQFHFAPSSEPPPNFGEFGLPSLSSLFSRWQTSASISFDGISTKCYPQITQVASPTSTSH
jgi:hypothetical protein